MGTRRSGISVGRPGVGIIVRLGVGTQVLVMGCIGSPGFTEVRRGSYRVCVWLQSSAKTVKVSWATVHPSPQGA